MVGCSAGSLRAERIAFPAGIFYYQPAASVYGSEAVWINPAAIGKLMGGYQFMADYSDDQFAKNWGTVLTRSGIGLAYRKLDGPGGLDYEEKIWSMALPLGKKLDLGSSYRYFSEGPGVFNNRHFWSLSLLGRSSGPYRWAAVFSNLNRGRVDGLRTETEMRYSLAYRPFKKSLTVAVDMFLSTGMKLSEADYTYHVEYTPTPGLYLNGFINSDKTFQIGVRTNLRKYFTGVRNLFKRSGSHARTTLFAGASSLMQPSLVKPIKRRLSLAVGRSIPENPPRPFFGRKPISFTTLITSIYRAADDPSIAELSLSLTSSFSGLAQAQEFRAALFYFKSRNKKITAHLSSPGNLTYYVASAADQILIPPISQLNLVGLKAELTFYAGTLEKLGARADLVRIGDYKTATEMFTNRSSSVENQAQINRLLDDIYDQFVTALANGRQLPEDSIRHIIDNGPLTSEQALAFGMVDGLSYRDEMHKTYSLKLPGISFRKYLADTLVNDDWPAKPKVAVIVATGEVSAKKKGGFFSQRTTITPGEMKKALAEAIYRKDIKAIVLRINSPGGEALAAEQICHYFQKAAKKKPIVISMGNVAASGAYNISMAGSKLFASPGTITGSIGIFGGKIDLSELYRKIEVGKELYTRGRYAGMMSSTRAFTDEEREKYYSQIEAFYSYFVDLVAENRSLSKDSVDQLSRGRVWTGREAVAIGLIDELGGLKQSMDYAASQAGLEEYSFEILPRRRTYLSIPGLGLLRRFASLFSKDDPLGEAVEELSGLSGDEQIMSRMLFDLEIE